MPNTVPQNLVWWPDTGKKLAAKVMARARDIATRQALRRANDETHLRLYSEDEWRGTYGIEKRRLNAVKQRDQRKGKLSINVVRNMVNAATSMLIRSRPYISFQTDGADYSLMKLSRKRERFVQAHFIRDRIHQLSQARVRNAALFGTGGTKVIRVDGKITFENILPGEILVDEQEGIGADPPCIYQAKTVDKLRLAEMYPEFRDQILKAGSAGGIQGESGSQCTVVYAWHFRSTGKKKHDGVEALCVDGATLYKRPYKWPRFPGNFFRWEETPFGFYGTGIPAELIGIQYEINTLLRMIRDSCYYGGNVKILLQKGSNVTLSQLSNSTRIPIIEYVGAEPKWVTNDVASAQIFQHLQYLVQTAYQVTGISQLDAQSQTPAATMSGRARLVHQNNESLRFKAAVERYENGYIELAESVLWMATDMAEDKEDQTVIFRGHEHLEEISYSDVALKDDEDGCDIQAWSSSQLAQSPGARIEQVDFLVQNGYLQKTRGLVMMDLGNDYKADMDMANAPYHLVDERLERITMADDPEAVPPQLLVASPYMDLQYAKERAQLEIQRCELRGGVPEENIDMLRDFLDSVTDELNKATQPSTPPAGAGAPPLPGANAVPAGPPPGAPPMIPPGGEMGVAA